MSEGTVSIGRVRVRRWEVAGEPARLVVLVHGYGEHIGRYAHVAEALAARGATVVGPDHVGHGRRTASRHRSRTSSRSSTTCAPSCRTRAATCPSSWSATRWAA